MKLRGENVQEPVGAANNLFLKVNFLIVKGENKWGYFLSMSISSLLIHSFIFQVN
jgi:hypothetical protein